MMPDVLLTVANLCVSRKPDRGPTIYPDPLADRALAANALGFPQLDTSQLGALRELHETVLELVNGLIGGQPVGRSATRLAELAQPSTATVGLEASEDQLLRTKLDWSEPTPAATLARRIILELGEIDQLRLKRCERPACSLVFYDRTRSGTQRWHAESPCGNRERQRRHRAVSRHSPPTVRP